MKHSSLRGAAGAILAAIPLAAAATAAAHLQDPAGDPADARAALERWVETRRVIARERQEWAIGKDLLEGRIALVEREIGSLRAAIDEAKAGLAQVDGQRAQLLEEKERFDAAARALADAAGDLEARTRELLARAPAPARERVQPLAQRLPETRGETKASLGERFQNIAGIVNELNRFQREVTVTSEVREVGGGTTAEVTTLYLGLGQAWYAGSGGRFAGSGRPGPAGWVWVSDPGAAAEIASAIAIARNEQPPRFVRLPIRVE